MDQPNKTQYSFETSHIVGIESRGFVMGSILAYAMDLPYNGTQKGAKYPGIVRTKLCP